MREIMKDLPARHFVTEYRGEEPKAQFPAWDQCAVSLTTGLNAVRGSRNCYLAREIIWLVITNTNGRAKE
jgi:hypothetical protein